MQDKSTLVAYLISNFPGIFEKNSEEERGLLGHQKQQKPDKFKYSKELAGVGEDAEQASWNMVHLEEMASKTDGFTQYSDFQTLFEIDFRVRFCRATLSQRLPIGWTDSGEDFWPSDVPILKLPDLSPLDFLISASRKRPLRKVEYDEAYYAAKCLGHFRRAKFLQDCSGGHMAVWREWMLFGDAWTAASMQHGFGVALGRDV